jgi:hypothetical protein
LLLPSRSSNSRLSSPGTSCGTPFQRFGVPNHHTTTANPCARRGSSHWHHHLCHHLDRLRRVQPPTKSPTSSSSPLRPVPLPLLAPPSRPVTFQGKALPTYEHHCHHNSEARHHHLTSSVPYRAVKPTDLLYIKRPAHDTIKLGLQWCAGRRLLACSRRPSPGPSTRLTHNHLSGPQDHSTQLPPAISTPGPVHRIEKGTYLFGFVAGAESLLTRQSCSIVCIPPPLSRCFATCLRPHCLPHQVLSHHTRSYLSLFLVILLLRESITATHPPSLYESFTVAVNRLTLGSTPTNPPPFDKGFLTTANQRLCLNPRWP